MPAKRGVSQSDQGKQQQDGLPPHQKETKARSTIQDTSREPTAKAEEKVSIVGVVGLDLE